MKNQNSLKWIIKNSKGEIPKIFILSISNILLALVATVLALVSKLAIDSAQRAATASSNAEFLHYRIPVPIPAVSVYIPNNET